MSTGITFKISEVSESAISFLRATKDVQFNEVPIVGSWTMGQAGEHVLKSCHFIFKALTGPSKIADRDPKENVARIESVFLNFDDKMVSPDFIKPSEEPKHKEELISALQTQMDQIKEIADTGDLELVCTNFEFPGSGFLTSYEWLTFYYCHTKRHIQQFEKIKKMLDN